MKIKFQRFDSTFEIYDLLNVLQNYLSKYITLFTYMVLDVINK